MNTSPHALLSWDCHRLLSITRVTIHYRPLPMSILVIIEVWISRKVMIIFIKNVYVRHVDCKWTKCPRLKPTNSFVKPEHLLTDKMQQLPVYCETTPGKTEIIQYNHIKSCMWYQRLYGRYISHNYTGGLCIPISTLSYQYLYLVATMISFCCYIVLYISNHVWELWLHFSHYSAS